MMRGARTTRRGLFAMIALAARNSRLRKLDDDGAGLPIAGCATTSRGSVDGDAGCLQGFARQIEPAERSVLVEVAQNVGELQRAAEMMRERNAGVMLPCRTRARERRPTAHATRSQ